MQGNPMFQMVIVGGGTLFIFWLTFRVGRVVWNRPGMQTALTAKPFFIMSNQPDQESSSFKPVPDGQERLATQPERDDINEKIERAHIPSTVSNTPL
jgi:hypothetical protein